MVAEGLQRVVADGGVAGDCLHDSYLCRPHVEREVLVVSGRSARASCSQSADCVSSLPCEQEEDGVSQESHAVLHTDYHLLPHPLGYQVVAEHDHHGPGHEPDGEERQKGIIKPALIREASY